MFVDQEFVTLFQGESTRWLEQFYPDWRPSGIEPTLFSRGIPMKRIVLDENGNNNHRVALKYFAMAHRSKKVHGVPNMLISLRMPPRDVLQGIWNKTLRTYPEQHTLAFLKTLTSDNFPGIGDVEARPIDPDAGKYLLELGYAFLNHNPPRSNENLDTQLLMPHSQIDDDCYEMFVDKDKYDLFRPDWRKHGIQADLFDGSIPMKRIFLENGYNDHTVALKYYAMAYRRKNVRGIPHVLISLRMAPRDVLQGIWNKSLSTYPQQHTLAFQKTLNLENLPGVRNMQVNPINPDDAKDLLNRGFDILNQNRPMCTEA